MENIKVAPWRAIANPSSFAFSYASLPQCDVSAAPETQILIIEDFIFCLLYTTYPKLQTRLVVDDTPQLPYCL